MSRHEGSSETPSMNAEGQPNCKRVKARGNGHNKQLRVLQLSTYGLVAALYRLNEHLYADEGQQEKADVGRPGAHEAADRAAEQITYERHEELETAEIKPQKTCVLRAEALDGEAAGDGNGEGVH